MSYVIPNLTIPLSAAQLSEIYGINDVSIHPSRIAKSKHSRTKKDILNQTIDFPHAPASFKMMLSRKPDL
ncbi:unnamed protein product [Periconia digitata]|uniref:Uncharacterized protein n=1 Tax=Periconia digitata TaxID=1303443 RepID=A0A9W4XQA2_9PLEO|nr:unnamed protein product [Periconia digitata]